MPMSITLAPLERMPSASAAASSGPDNRPSRPTTNVSRPCFRASEPSAWPMSRTIGAVSVLPTTPRMSYALKMSAGKGIGAGRRSAQ